MSTRSRSVVLALALAFFAQSGLAATLATWSQAGQPGNQASTPGGSSFAEVTASAMTRGPGLAASGAVNSLSATGWDGANSDDYFEFSITLDAGSQASLQELLIGTRSSATGPGTIGVFTSLDGFLAPIATVSQAPGGNFVNSAIDLSGLGVVTGTLTLRLYEVGDTQADGVGATASGGTFRVADYFAPGSSIGTAVQITGTLSAVPEPSLALLCVTAGIALAARRR